MPQASENRHPRIALRPAVAKKPSRVTLREPKASPTKGLASTRSPGSIDRIPPRSTVRSKSPDKPCLVSPAKRFTKRSVDTPSPSKVNLRSKVSVQVDTCELSEDDNVLSDTTNQLSSHEEQSDHSSHSHPVLAIDGLSEFTKHMFMGHGGEVSAAPPIPLKDPRRQKPAANDTDADDEGSETFEDKIRSALATPGNHNYHHRAQTPSSVKSVRWDPAVITYGRETSKPPAISDDSPWVSPPSTNKPRPDVTDVLKKTLSRLKKEDQQILRDFLRNLDSPKSDNESIFITQRPRREETKERYGLDGMFAKKLNPEAPEFPAIATPMKRGEHDTSKSVDDEINALFAEKEDEKPREPIVVTSTPRKGLKREGATVPKVERNTKEPVWINIYNPPSLKDMPAGFSKMASNPLNRHNGPKVQPTQGVNMHRNSDYMPLDPMWQAPLFDPSQTVWVPMPMVSTPHGFQALPMLPSELWSNAFSQQNQLTSDARKGLAQNRPPQYTRRPPPPHKTRSANGPIVDVALCNVPPEWGPGRVAQPVNETWGKSLLNQFSAKYPKTGRVDPRARRQAPGQMREAAAIQQKLELLIYAEKEKAAALNKQEVFRQPVEKKAPVVKVMEKGSSSSSGDDPFSCSEGSTIVTSAPSVRVLNKSW